MSECRNYQKLINRYAMYRLTGDSLRDFVEHVVDCNDCREELEIYYTIRYGLEEDDSSNVNDNYKKYIDSCDYNGLVDKRIKDDLIVIRKNERLEKASSRMALLVNALLVFLLFLTLILKYF